MFIVIVRLIVNSCIVIVTIATYVFYSFITIDITQADTRERERRVRSAVQRHCRRCNATAINNITPTTTTTTTNDNNNNNNHDNNNSDNDDNNYITTTIDNIDDDITTRHFDELMQRRCSGQYEEEDEEKVLVHYT